MNSAYKIMWFTIYSQPLWLFDACWSILKLARSSLRVVIARTSEILQGNVVHAFIDEDRQATREVAWKMKHVPFVLI
jgi:hypothetical protein